MIVAVLARPHPRPDACVAHLLTQVAGAVDQPRNPVNHVHHEVIAVEVVQLTMSKGVVVVPSSLYPRTWMLSWLVRR